MKLQRIDPDVPMPTYAHEGDAGFDLFAREAVTMQPGEQVQVKTGIALHIPDGYVGLVWDKSGLSHRHALKTLGGVVDAGYRGEVMVGLVNLGDEPYTVEKHHKVAQMLIQKVERAEFDVVASLDESARGHGSFGSTGK